MKVRMEHPLTSHTKRDICLCGQEKHPLMAWCYQCKTQIAKTADLSQGLIMDNIRLTKLRLAHLRAALEVGKGPDVA